jgi:hypothetical protein
MNAATREAWPEGSVWRDCLRIAKLRTLVPGGD